MVKVKGFEYYNDNNCPSFEMSFENLGQLAYFIKDNVIGKDIKFPAQNADGTFDKAYAGSFSGDLRYCSKVSRDGLHISSHIELIKDQDGKILFSSGSLTDKIGHISQAMKEMLENLKTWKNKSYDFAD